LQSGVEGGALLGRITQWVLLALTIVLALDQLKLDTTLILVLMVVLVGAAALALALSFGLGTRELAGRIVAGFHAKELYTRGQTLRVAGYTGQLVRVGTSVTTLDTEEGRVSIPNDVLLREEVVVTGGPGFGDAPPAGADAGSAASEASASSKDDDFVEVGDDVAGTAEHGSAGSAKLGDEGAE
jgi:hypothetical protein